MNLIESDIEKPETHIMPREPLAWLISIMFTDKFYNKLNWPQSIIIGYKDFLFQVMDWVHSNNEAKAMLAAARKSSLAIDDKEEVDTVEFAYWVEKAGGRKS